MAIPILYGICLKLRIGGTDLQPRYFSNEHISQFDLPYCSPCSYSHSDSQSRTYSSLNDAVEDICAIVLRTLFSSILAS